MDKEEKFKQFVIARHYDDNYIDLKEEKEIIDYGIKELDLTVNHMIQYLDKESGYFLERKLQEKFENKMSEMRISEHVKQEDVKYLFNYLKDETKGKVKHAKLSNLIQRTMKENGCYSNKIEKMILLVLNKIIQNSKLE